MEYREPMATDPGEIEKLSMRIIREELAESGRFLPDDADEGEVREKIVLRVIHATADLEYADTMAFSDHAVTRIQAAIREGARIVTDTNMALSGVSRKSLARFGGEAVCFMADPDVAKEAKRRGITRAAVSMERAERLPGKSVFAIGNAPTALIRLKELIDAGYRPAGVIGVPVGFVNVEYAKELIMETDVPWIVNRGRKGGSGVAAAICNAILYDMPAD